MATVMHGTIAHHRRIGGSQAVTPKAPQTSKEAAPGVVLRPLGRGTTMAVTLRRPSGGSLGGLS